MMEKVSSYNMKTVKCGSSTEWQLPG